MHVSDLPVLYPGYIPKNFKIFIFEPKLSFFWENRKNDNQGFYKFTLYMIF